MTKDQQLIERAIKLFHGPESGPASFGPVALFVEDRTVRRWRAGSPIQTNLRKRLAQWVAEHEPKAARKRA